MAIHSINFERTEALVERLWWKMERLTLNGAGGLAVGHDRALPGNVEVAIRA